MSDHLPKPARYEPITKARVDALARALGKESSMLARVHEIDIARGTGIIASNEVCFWLRDGRRVTFRLFGASIAATISAQTDTAHRPDKQGKSRSTTTFARSRRRE